MKAVNKYCQFILGSILFVNTSCTHTVKVRKNLFEVRETWNKDTTANFILYYPANSYPDSNKRFIKSSIEQYRLEILSLMKENIYVQKIETFFFPSKLLMNKTLLTKAEGISYASDNICAFIYAKQFNGYTKHELSHIFSINIWGRSATWIEEGFATLADESFQTSNFHKQTKSLLGTADFINPEELFKNFNKYNGNWYRYVESASLLKYVMDKYGISAVKNIWKTRKFATEQAKQSELLNEWIYHLGANVN